MIALSDGTPHALGKPFTVCIRTAARALCHINRFTGHVGAYSVAQHSVLVASRLPPELRLAGLLHDLPEAYLGDVSSPLKALIGPKYRELEEFYHDQIDAQFKVDTRHPDIKAVDLRMCVTEAMVLGLPMDCFPDIEPYNVGLCFARLSPEAVEREFMRIFREETCCA